MVDGASLLAKLVHEVPETRNVFRAAQWWNSDREDIEAMKRSSRNLLPHACCKFLLVARSPHIHLMVLGLPASRIPFLKNSQQLGL